MPYTYADRIHESPIAKIDDHDESFDSEKCTGRMARNNSILFLGFKGLSSEYRGRNDEYETRLEREIGNNIVARGRKEIEEIYGAKTMAFIDDSFSEAIHVLKKSIQRLYTPLSRDTRHILKDFVGVKSQKGNCLDNIAEYVRERLEVLHNAAVEHLVNGVNANQIGMFGGQPRPGVLAVTSTPEDEKKYKVKMLDRILFMPDFFHTSGGEAAFTLIHEISHYELGTLDLKYFYLGGASQSKSMSKFVEDGYVLHRKIARANGEGELRRMLITSTLDLTRMSYERLFAKKLAEAKDVEHKAALFLGNADTLALLAFKLGHA
ncbi:hypothetical protein [Chromobacterium haemolyticum]|uniref:hypothetical protein n=1 Tax=Chromobacterium haemolyticum TaxID=394935 RepID=UPI0024471EA4|nr:hypothetical protein [Chromobacterium haemolyticum]MDH0344675.1 hypothetical protein [Chromobacterium haemolyticum]